MGPAPLTGLPAIHAATSLPKDARRVAEKRPDGRAREARVPLPKASARGEGFAELLVSIDDTGPGSACGRHHSSPPP
jgi:hypothetical protein